MNLLVLQQKLHTNNVMEKGNKKDSTISSDLKKKIDTSSVSTGGKKSFSVKKKDVIKGNKGTQKLHNSTFI